MRSNRHLDSNRLKEVGTMAMPISRGNHHPATSLAKIATTPKSKPAHIKIQTWRVILMP
jgi:hypothetical protein